MRFLLEITESNLLMLEEKPKARNIYKLEDEWQQEKLQMNYDLLARPQTLGRATILSAVKDPNYPDGTLSQPLVFSPL